MASKPPNPIRDFTTFGIGLGLLIGVGGYLAVSMDSTAPPIAGMQRGLVFGVPLLLLSALMVTAGILVMRRMAIGVTLLVVAGFLLLAGDLAVEIGIMGTIFAFRLFSLLVYIIPFTLLVKSSAARAAIEASHQPAAAAPTGTSRGPSGDMAKNPYVAPAQPGAPERR
jgi:hypothetical protein